MSRYDAIFQLCALACLLFAFCASGLTGLGYWAARGALLGLAPRNRVRVLRALACGPACLGPLLVAICFLPSALGLDHCLSHTGHHAHFCMKHLYVGASSVVGWFLLGGVALIVAPIAGKSAIALRRSRRIIDGVCVCATPDADSGTLVLQTNAALSFAAGLFAPVACISTGLMAALSPGELRAVVEHELAHVRRRDTLWRLLTRALSLSHWPPVRQQLLNDLNLAVEQACDEEAAAHVGDRLTVASALVASQKLMQATVATGELASAFGALHLCARVEALAEAPATRSLNPVPVISWTILAVTAVFSAAGSLHEAAETIFSLLFR